MSWRRRKKRKADAVSGSLKVFLNVRVTPSRRGFTQILKYVSSFVKAFCKSLEWNLVVGELAKAEEAESGRGLGDLERILKYSCYTLAKRVYTAAFKL